LAVTTTQLVPPFMPQTLEGIARVLGDTNDGLTGPEIGRLLMDCQIPDPSPDMTKWKRLFNAFVEFQNEHQAGNHVVVFIRRAMNPASYTAYPHLFDQHRHNLNAVLAFAGMELGEDGRLRRAQKASTLDEAFERANRFQASLRQRNVHADVLRFCSAEILAKNYFHAVFEAMKSVTAKIRNTSGLSSDGADLVDDAFSFGKGGVPLLAFSPLNNEHLRGEHRGFVSLLKGLYGTIRNPLAHTPKIEWEMTEQDALDILTMISLVHRKLDRATRYDPKSST